MPQFSEASTRELIFNLYSIIQRIIFSSISIFIGAVRKLVYILYKTILDNTHTYTHTQNFIDLH